MMVVEQMLGKGFDGIINCDYHSSYRKFMKDSSAIMQFCLAHLIRDQKFLAEQNDKVTRNLGATNAARLRGDVQPHSPS